MHRGRSQTADCRQLWHQAPATTCGNKRVTCRSDVQSGRAKGLKVSACRCFPNPTNCSPAVHGMIHASPRAWHSWRSSIGNLRPKSFQRVAGGRLLGKKSEFHLLHLCGSFQLPNVPETPIVDLRRGLRDALRRLAACGVGMSMRCCF